VQRPCAFGCQAKMSKLFLAAIIALVFPTACKKSSVESSLLLYIGITGPDSVRVNTGCVPIVTCFYSNSCDKIGYFQQEVKGNTVLVKAHNAPLPREAICLAVVGSGTKEYNFISSSKGVFELRFLNPDNSFLSHTITVY
jgi:hypothetical protein